MRLSDASIFQNPAARSFNSLRRDGAPPNWGFANIDANFDVGGGAPCTSDEEVRRRFSSLLNLARGNQFLNDLDECSEGHDENWERNNFEMEGTSPENDLNSYSDLIYDNRRVAGNPDDNSYGFLRGVVRDVNCGVNFERDDVNSDRWQMNEGLNLNRWSPPRDTNHRFRSTDTWVTFQNA